MGLKVKMAQCELDRDFFELKYKSILNEMKRRGVAIEGGRGRDGL